MTEDEFWDYVDRSGGPDACWPWTRSCVRAGYGQLWIGDRKLASHRVAFKLANGEIPDGSDVLHSCDNPPCCNPRHLFEGDAGVNLRDAIAKGRHRPPDPVSRPGEAHPMAKLSTADVAEIRRVGGSVSQRALGRRFGVGQTQISRILNGSRWKEA